MRTPAAVLGAVIKVGRNDPCPCGSGRKHKHCCGGPAAGEPLDLRWHRINRLVAGLPTDLMTFARREHGMAPLTEAWEEFLLDSRAPFDPDSIHLPVFVPWFLHNWIPDPLDTGIPEGRDDDFPIAQAYIRRHRTRLDPLLVGYLEACGAAPFSFHDVVSVTPGTGFSLRDIIRGTTVDVIERSASETVERGSILLARVVPIDGLAVLDGCGAVAFPPIEKAAVLELRRHIRKRCPSAITDEQLREYDIEILEVYLEVADRLLNPRPPVMQNTDGELLELCTVTYEIESVRATFEALSPLAAGSSTDELLEGAGLDGEGELQQVELPWLRPGRGENAASKSTVLGRLVIDGRRLVVEVNSQERARRFRAIADEVLPPGSRHLSTVVEPIEAALVRHRAERSAVGPEPEAGAEDLAQRPEVKALMAETLRAHYREWVDMELPALGGKTPAQAMRTADGREMVEALLTQLEMNDRRGGQAVGEETFQELRATLDRAAHTPRKRGDG